MVIEAIAERKDIDDSEDSEKGRSRASDLLINHAANAQIFANTDHAMTGDLARADSLNVAKQKKPCRRKVNAAIRRQLDNLQRNLEAIDAVIAAGAGLSGLKVHWWHKLQVISELHRKQSIPLNAKTRSTSDRIVNLAQRHVCAIAREKCQRYS